MIHKISYVIPVFNEEGNLEKLFDELRPVAEKLGIPYEVLFVDDGSRDGSLAVIHNLACMYTEVRWLSMDRNCGQSAALYVGFQQVRGDVIVTMDADLQNDPADIPKLLDYFGEYQMVNGWRTDRQDTWSKKVGSRIGNFVRNFLTGEDIHDTGCSLKVMEAAKVKRIKLFRGLHRFLPTLMRLEGARVIEVPVNHRARLCGHSKYSNLSRGIEGFYDVIAVRWMIKRHLKVAIKEDNA
ncbi:MAG: glycosyltransferase family 2 protein [Syntrophotalea acetylenica]|nr:glycosyltransferase family 2 protein [Syntrophotalea acetylenica]